MSTRWDPYADKYEDRDLDLLLALEAWHEDREERSASPRYKALAWFGVIALGLAGWVLIVTFLYLLIGVLS